MRDGRTGLDCLLLTGLIGEDGLNASAAKTPLYLGNLYIGDIGFVCGFNFAGSGNFAVAGLESCLVLRANSLACL